MTRSSQGAPAKLNGQSDSRGALAATTRHRATALIGQALDLIVGDPTGRDPAAALAELYWSDPKAFIDWVHKRTGGDDDPSGGALTNMAVGAFAGIFAGAAAQAAAQERAAPPQTDGTRPPTIDVALNEPAMQDDLQHKPVTEDDEPIGW